MYLLCTGFSPDKSNLFFPRTEHRVQNMGEGVHVEERGRAFGLHHSSHRYFRAERAVHPERHLPDPRLCVHPMGQAEHLLGLDRLLLHQLQDRKRFALRGDRSVRREESSRERRTFLFFSALPVRPHASVTSSTR